MVEKMPLLQLPIELQEQIVSLLDFQSVKSLSCCNRWCNALVENILWERVYIPPEVLFADDDLSASFQRMKCSKDVRLGCGPNQGIPRYFATNHDIAADHQFNYKKIRSCCNNLQILHASLSCSWSIIDFCLPHSLTELHLYWCCASGQDDAALHLLLGLQENLKLLSISLSDITEDSLGYMVVDYGTLEKLVLNRCPLFGSIKGIGKIASLKELEITHCHSISDIEELGNLKNLAKLKIRECDVKLEYDCSEWLGKMDSLREVDMEVGFYMSDDELILETWMLEKCEINFSHLTDIGLKYLQKFTRLKQLDLSDNKVHHVYGDGGSLITGVGLGYLSALTKLEFLDLSECTYHSVNCDDLLFNVGRIVSLRELRLREIDIPITAIGLDHLTKLENLRILDIQSNRIDDACLRAIASLSTLNHLLFTFNSTLSNGVGFLQQLTSLTALNIDNRAYNEVIKEEPLFAIAKLIQLKRLVLSGFNLTDKVILHIKNLTNLVELDICNNGESLSDMSLLYISSMNNLKKLDVGAFYEYTSAGCIQLHHLTNLQKLVITSKTISDTGFDSLCGIESLETLHIWGSFTLTEIGLSQIRKLINLKKLSLKNECVSAPVLFNISQLKQLQKLTINCKKGTNFTDGLGDLASLLNLHHFNMTLYGYFNEKEIEYIGNLSNLKTLILFDSSIARCKGGLYDHSFLDKNGLMRNFHHLTNLQKLDLRNGYSLHIHTMALLANARKTMKD